MKYDDPRLKMSYSGCALVRKFQPRVHHILMSTHYQYNTIQYNIRLLEAVRTQRRTIIEREKYVENENVKMVHNE